MAVVASWDFAARRIYMLAAEWHPYDIYTEYRAYRRLNESARGFMPLLKMDGNVPKSPTKATPRYVVLLGDADSGAGGLVTKIIPVDGSVEPVTSITGEIFAVDQSDFIDISGLTVAPRINYEPPSAEIIIKIAQALQIEYASFESAVSVDVTNGVAGTEYPLGTPGSPVNNLADAKLIASTRGLAALSIKGSATISNNDFDGFEIHGKQAYLTLSGVENTKFYKCFVQGSVETKCWFEDCAVLNLICAGQRTHFFRCGFAGTITASNNNIVVVDGVSAVSGENYSTFNFGGSGTKLDIRGFIGRLKLTNKTGTEPVMIYMTAGRIWIDSTVTAGLVGIGGITNIINESTATVVSEDVVNEGEIATAILAAAQVTPIESTSQARVVEDGKTEAEVLRLVASVLAGKVSGAGTGTERFRDIADTKDRVVSTVDSSGNRTVVVYDGT